MRIPLILLLTALLSAGCAGPRVADHAGFEPELGVEEFFSGEMRAYGVVRNRGGTVIRTFSADITAASENGSVTLDESFVFDDGELDTRFWTLTPKDDGTWSGTAGDVVGEGVLQQSGNALFLDYVLRIPYGDGTIDVRVDDRMYRVAPHLLVNESVMSKFGVDVGSILLVIERLDGRS